MDSPRRGLGEQGLGQQGLGQQGRDQPRESPRPVYARRLAAAEAAQARERRRDRSLGIANVTVFLAAVIAGFALLHTPRRLIFLLIPAAVLLVLAAVHQRVLARLRRASRSVEFYLRGLARLENRWLGKGEPGDRFLDPAHPYARDLDLFGSGSLFELLCTARTRAGEQTLARWLLTPAPPDEVRERQAAVTELMPHLDLREKLFSAGEDVRVGVHPEALLAWAQQPPAFQSRWLAPLLAILGILWEVSAFYWLIHALLLLGPGIGPAQIGGAGDHAGDLLLLSSIVNFGVSYLIRARAARVADAAEQAAADIAVLAEVLRLIEQQSFTSPQLRRVRESLDTGGICPSAAIRRLRWIAQWLEARHNMFIRLVAGLAFYNEQVTLAAERWHARFARSIPGWLTAVGDFEALSTLAGYAAEHPATTFPEFTDERPFFAAEALSHPLLADDRAVANDLRLTADTQLIVISGPNMAGKSTFLRGVGLNVVLAQCGAPVRARHLRLSSLNVGASICVLDSLQGGVSRFYAEIRRLKAISDLARAPMPLLFLLDELLSGTNSHDRYEGTRHVVRSLVRHGAIGLVTTHDLALTEIPGTLDGIARNCHFEDSVRNGELYFDYQLKPGIVQTSNALRLMKAVGLEIGDPDPGSS